MTQAATAFCHTSFCRVVSHSATVAAVTAMSTDAATIGKLKARLPGTRIADMPV